MDQTLINDVARAVHLLGMALGFGVAFIADLLAARAMVRPLKDHELRMLHSFHKVVSFGLLLLWTSGLVLLWLRTGFQSENFSPKLMTKIGVVLLLTANAIAIGRIGLPTMYAYQSWRFGDLPLSIRLQMSSLATISAACWFSALSLGVFTQLRPLPWETLSLLVGVTYMVALAAALTAATVSPIVAYFARWRESRPRLFRELPQYHT